MSVEGPTEERFVQIVLAPYLLNHSIVLTPISIGGNVSVDRIASELKKLSNSFDYVTTFYDFYGFKKKDEGETKSSLEDRIKNAVPEGVQRKLIAYIQMYEFEGILFSCADGMARGLNDSTALSWCTNILSEFGNNPEAINNSPQTAPSKRLEANTNYRKTIHGPNIAKEIGIDVIREKCSGFDQWLDSLLNTST
ncbi:DUF4276 family protein [Thalassolituus oleivorans]|uniref:DUF4276 family protein n=1 Tax=Thalassolituus oleivorans TaxID=187493 RepID=UPI001CE31705|nr:DUF4276 family protein [Thalassolituus oleivorans]